MDKVRETGIKHAKESKVKRRMSSSTSIKKQTRIKAADVDWCINNVVNLSAKTFASTFKHSDRQYCHARYRLILESHIQEEHRGRLQDKFETWRKTMDCTKFWVNQQRAKDLAEANDNCSVAANNLLIANTQEIRSSVAKYYVPEISTCYTIFRNKCRVYLSLFCIDCIIKFVKMRLYFLKMV
jgi:hypothetical protein